MTRIFESKRDAPHISLPKRPRSGSHRVAIACKRLQGMIFSPHQCEVMYRFHGFESHGLRRVAIVAYFSYWNQRFPEEPSQPHSGPRFTET